LSRAIWEGKGKESGGLGGFSSPAPSIGQHNREVYGGILGILDAEMEKLKSEGII
jgi:CoA:oxalate CoA-transferase